MVDRVRLGAFDVSVCVVEFLVTEKQLRQGVMIPKQEIVPVECGRDPEGCLVVGTGNPPWSRVIISNWSTVGVFSPLTKGHLVQ